MSERVLTIASPTYALYARINAMTMMENIEGIWWV